METFEVERQCILQIYAIMTSESNNNLIYESLFCLWNISNEVKYLKTFENGNNKFVENIVLVIKTNKIDKITRIGLMIVKVIF